MTRSAGRFSGFARAAAVVVLAAWLALPAVPARAQQVEDITGNLERYRGLLAVANQRLEDLELPEALAGFTEVIDGYLTGQLPTTTPLTRQIVGQAYDGRARTLANLGRTDEAAADFEALIRFDVDWPIDRDRTSPKIVALYDEVRGRVVGTFALRTEPPGALVSLNGEAVGRSPIFDRDLPAGVWTLDVRADGHEAVTETLTVEGGARVDRDLVLTPNARDIFVATSPAGATVSLDGQDRGTTFGVAGPEYAEVAGRIGITAAEISAPLLVSTLPPGDHLLRVSKECYEPQVLSISIQLDPNDRSPVRFEPIRLTPSTGTIIAESVPEGAEVLLDGRPAGRAPARIEAVCSGRHSLVMRRPGVGQWIGEVDVARGQRLTVGRTLRMTLAYVGMTVPGPGNEAPAGEEEIGEALDGLASWNVVRPGAGLPEGMLARKAASAGDGLTAAWVAEVAEETGADLVLAATPGEGAFERRVEISLHAPRFPELTERLSVSLEDPGPLRGLVERLDRPTALSRPWLGLRVIEVLGAPNPLALRVVPGGPAAEAGVSVGDGVVALGGRPIATPADLEQALAGLTVGARASLTLQAPGQAPRQANVTVGETPVVLPFEDADRLDALAAVELSFRSRLEDAAGRADGRERGAALLGLASILMHRGLHDAALGAALQGVRLPPGGGISAGTASYLQGVCMRALGRLTEARQYFEAAAGQPDATLWSNDGPPVADRARRALATL